MVKAHKRDSGELWYCIEKEGQKKWYKRMAVILSLEQGNKLREQFGLGPYEPSMPLTKGSDISLGNGFPLVFHILLVLVLYNYVRLFVKQNSMLCFSIANLGVDYL